MTPPLGSARAGLVSQVGDEIPDSVVDRPDDDTTQGSSFTSDFGILMSVSQEWQKFQGRLSSLVDTSLSRAYIYDTNDNLMGDVDISSVGANEVFTVDLSNNLVAGNKYKFVCDAEGATYDPSRLDNPTYNYVSADGNLSIVSGASVASSSPDDPHHIIEAGNINL